MASPARIASCALHLQLFLLSATWLAGIYVNGFVAILPGEDAESILLTPAIALHVVIASLSAATGIIVIILVRLAGARRSTALMSLATLSIFIAGGSGLTFVLGAASDSAESMLMATAFITAIFLTFLSLAELVADGRSSSATVKRKTGRIPLIVCYVALLFGYLVFVSGIYVNLFVAGPVFSLPLNSELTAFRHAELTGPFVFHEFLGGAYLLSLAVLDISLWYKGARRLSLIGALPVLFVTYSAYIGSLNLTSPLSPVSAGIVAVLIPMLSAAAFIGAIVITMLLAVRIRETAAR